MRALAVFLINMAVGAAVAFLLLKARFHQRDRCPICGYADRIRQIERDLASDQDQGPTRRSP